MSCSKREQLQAGKDSGRVKVYVRIRPLNREENASKIRSVLQVSEEDSQICIAPDMKGKSDRIFQFDHVFSSSKTNQQVCEQLSKPIVNAALNGFNGTLMAYGQTGTGKTHTLMAPDGITHDIIHKVFDNIHVDRKHEFKVSASYLQIYQEKIHDLLNINTKVELSIRENPKAGIYVENLTEYVIRSPAEALSLITFGKRRLVFAETKMNRTSSRSHSVFQLKIERAPRKERQQAEENTNKEIRKMKPLKKDATESVVQMIGLDEEVIVKGKIHLCDLAGSERVKKTHASGERLSEAQHINSSLLELGNVIQALADNKKTHVPFRNSVLTRLLQESLGGNCKTSLIVCVSPSLTDVSETKSTLNFGSRAMKITNIAYVNMEVDFKRLSESLLKKIEQQELELQELRRKGGEEWQNEKKELLRELEKISGESELIIKSLRKMYEKQVSELVNTISELNKEISLKERKNAKLQMEINSMKKAQVDEEKVAKLLLLNELASLEMLTATEGDKWLEKDKEKYDEARASIIVDLTDHCQKLLEYSSIYLSESTAFTDMTSHSEDSDCSCIGMKLRRNGLEANADSQRNAEGSKRIDAEKLRSVLVESKAKMKRKLAEIFRTKFETKVQGIETCGKVDESNNVLALCGVILDKGFLTSETALENLELRMKIASMMEQKGGKETQNIDGLKNTEIFAEKLKKAIEDQTDVDEMFVGFEFTLSKIEDILSEKGGYTEKGDVCGKIGKRQENVRLQQKGENVTQKSGSFKNKEKLSLRSVETKKSVGISMNVEAGQNVISCENKNERISYIKDGKIQSEMKDDKQSEKDDLTQSIRKKLEKNLDEFITNERKDQKESNHLQKLNQSKRTAKVQDGGCDEGKRRMDTIMKSNFVRKGNEMEERQKGLLKNPFSDCHWQEEDKKISELISDASDMTSAINEYIELENEINGMKKEMQRRNKPKHKKRRGQNGKHRIKWMQRNEEDYEKDKENITIKDENFGNGFTMKRMTEKRRFLEFRGKYDQRLYVYENPWREKLAFQDICQNATLIQTHLSADAMNWSQLQNIQGSPFFFIYPVMPHPVKPHPVMPHPVMPHPATQSYCFDICYRTCSSSCCQGNPVYNARNVLQSVSLQGTNKNQGRIPQGRIPQGRIPQGRIPNSNIEGKNQTEKHYKPNTKTLAKTNGKEPTSNGCDNHAANKNSLVNSNAGNFKHGLHEENQVTEGKFEHDQHEVKTNEEFQKEERMDDPSSSSLEKEMKQSEMQAIGFEASKEDETLVKFNCMECLNIDNSVEKRANEVQAKPVPYDGHQTTDTFANYASCYTKTDQNCEAYNKKKEENDTANSCENLDTKSLTSDEELDRKIESLFEDKNTADSNSNGKRILKNKQRKNSLTTKSFEQATREDCELLEVQIASGVLENRYGDSFLSPLATSNRDDLHVESELLCDLNESVTSLEVSAGEEDVVVKKSWSISNWLWGKKSPRYKVQDVSVVIQ